MNSRPRPLWKLLLPAKNDSGPDSLDCVDCFAILEYLADWAGGGLLDRSMLTRLLRRHLSACPDCYQYYLDRLREMEAGGDGDQPSPPDNIYG